MQIIFLVLWDQLVYQEPFENRFLLKPVLEGCPVFHISLLVMNRLNLTKSAVFVSSMHYLLTKELFIQNLLLRTFCYCHLEKQTPSKLD